MLKLDVRVAKVFGHVLSNTPPGTRSPSSSILKKKGDFKKNKKKTTGKSIRTEEVKGKLTPALKIKFVSSQVNPESQ